MITTTTDFGVVGMARRAWSFPAVKATPAHIAHAAAIAAQRKRRANAAPTIASVDRSFI